MKEYAPVNLDIYEFFPIYAKKAKDHGVAIADIWLSDLIDEIKGVAHIKQGQVFLVDIEPQGWYNWLSPFHRINEAEDPQLKGYYNLKKNDSNYYKYLNGFLKTAAKKNYLFIPIFYASNYSEKMFLHNVNEVYGYLHEKGWKYQRKNVKKDMRLWKRAYGNKVLWGKPTNEIPHGGDWSKGVQVAWWFEKLYSYISGKVPLNRLIMDTSHSDFNKVCDRSVLTAAGKLMSYKSWLDIPASARPALEIVNGKQAIFPTKDYPRKGWPEAPHGVNLWMLQRPSEKHDTLWDAYQSPSWRQHSLSGDANSEGSGYQIPGTPFKELSADELYEYYYFIFKYRADNPNSAKFLMGLFPMHIFIREDTGYVHADLDRLDFEWLRQPHKAWVDAGKPKMF